MIQRGTNEVFLGGKKRPIKFGTAQTAIFCQLRGNITIAQAQELLSKDRWAAQDVEPMVLIQFYYSALESGARAAKQPVDFDVYDVADWMDESPETMGMMQDTAQAAVNPNPPAPAQTGQTEMAAG